MSVDLLRHKELLSETGSSLGWRTVCTWKSWVQMWGGVSAVHTQTHTYTQRSWYTLLICGAITEMSKVSNERHELHWGRLKGRQWICLLHFQLSIIKCCSMWRLWYQVCSITYLNVVRCCQSHSSTGSGTESFSSKGFGASRFFETPQVCTVDVGFDAVSLDRV